MKKKNKKKIINEIANMFRGLNDKNVDQTDYELFHRYDKMKRPFQSIKGFVLGVSLLLTGIPLMFLMFPAVLWMKIMYGIIFGSMVFGISLLVGTMLYKMSSQYEDLQVYKQIKELRENGTWEKIRAIMDKYETTQEFQDILNFKTIEPLREMSKKAEEMQEEIIENRNNNVIEL